MTTEQIEERARNLRIASLIYWNRGEIEASEVLRENARRLERMLEGTA